MRVTQNCMLDMLEDFRTTGDVTVVKFITVDDGYWTKGMRVMMMGRATLRTLRRFDRTQGF